jgi:nucleotide-binding universal stress UspA family protein
MQGEEINPGHRPKALAPRPIKERTMFKKLLVPVDLADRDPAKSALARAVSLARAGGGEVRLLFVMPYVPQTYLEYVPAGFEAEEKAKATLELEGLARELHGEVPISTRIAEGGVYHAVLAEAEAFGADLILVGSHRPSLATYLLGSHATNIVRYAKCSVLVVRN